MEEPNKKFEKKNTLKTGTLGTVSKVEIGKANNRRTILGLEKEAGKMGADASKVAIQKDGKKTETESKGDKPKRSLGQLGVKSSDMKLSEPKRFEWKTDAGGSRRDDRKDDRKGDRKDDRRGDGRGDDRKRSDGRSDSRRAGNVKAVSGQKKTTLTGSSPKKR